MVSVLAYLFLLWYPPVQVQVVCCPLFLRKHGDIKSHSSVCPSVCPSVHHKNSNLGHKFCTITDRALILGMCVLCDKTFPMVPCRDLDRDLWPTSRWNLLQSGGPQFYETVRQSIRHFITVLMHCIHVSLFVGFLDSVLLVFCRKQYYVSFSLNYDYYNVFVYHNCS